MIEPFFLLTVVALLAILALLSMGGVVRLRRQVRLLNTHLATAIEENRRTEREAMLGRIAQDLIHDLKHPVQNLKNCGANLERACSDADLRATLQVNFTREFDKISQFLDNLEHLTYDIPHRPIRLSLATLLTDVAESFGERAAQRRIRLQLPTQPPAIEIEGDRFSLNRLFSNLLANALDAIDTATTTTDNGRVKFDIRITGAMAVVTIEDSGRGIPAEKLPGLFENYWTSKAKGLGLGLAICKKIVTLHQGRIGVKSTIGTGTEFSVYLPLIASDR